MGIGAVRAVFLDRDGVLSQPVVVAGKPFPPESVGQFQIYPEAPFALERLKDHGFLLIVVTNQPDVARGTQTIEHIEAMHDKLAAELPVDEIRVCYHDDGDGCECRKPKPGLLIEAAREQGIDLAESFLIGDRWRDVEAGAAAGCRTVQIDRGYREQAPSREPDARVSSLSEAVEWIIQQTRPRNE